VVKLYPGCGYRLGIEGIAGIDHDAEFSATGGSGHSSQEHGSAAGGGRTTDFGETSAGQAAGQGIQGGNAAGSHFRRGPDPQPGGRSDQISDFRLSIAECSNG
jgi:hypothetical protein